MYTVQYTSTCLRTCNTGIPIADRPVKSSLSTISSHFPDGIFEVLCEKISDHMNFMFYFNIEENALVPFPFLQIALVPLENDKIALVPFKTEGNFLIAL